MTMETRSSVPTSAEIINWATAFGIVLALGILAMSVGLIRSETASDLRTLAATGAGSVTRRTLTAVTAGALALLGAVLGTAAGYVACHRLVPRQRAERRASAPWPTCPSGIFCSSWSACRSSRRPSAGCSRAGSRPPSAASRSSEPAAVADHGRVRPGPAKWLTAEAPPPGPGGRTRPAGLTRARRRAAR